ncbi:uncharacterized protein LOC111067510 [Drosophila obscura]|uniref:uncharacterized protein LOC111067510 n=1 Tax=Drosophila obscura TaxID=7282 RepID=UPI001BB26D9E|nr:uncharacterized protein LOC111067510 [Drosophila obscura]
MSSNCDQKVTSDTCCHDFDLYPTESDFALELKAVPKETCIPLNHTHIAKSESSVPNRRHEMDTQIRKAVMSQFSLNIKRPQE